jgi:hypothetical protein
MNDLSEPNATDYASKSVPPVQNRNAPLKSLRYISYNRDEPGTDDLGRSPPDLGAHTPLTRKSSQRYRSSTVLGKTTIPPSIEPLGKKRRQRKPGKYTARGQGAQGWSFGHEPLSDRCRDAIRAEGATGHRP